MKLRRVLVGLAAMMLAISLSGCTGLLRSMSSDNRVDSTLDENGYRLDTRDFTLNLPGQWDWLRGDAVIELPNASEYNVGVANADGVWVQARAEVRRGTTSDCAVELGRDLPELGWNVDGRYDSSVNVNGLDAALVRANKDGRELRAYCFRSEQAALVYLFVTSGNDVEAVAQPLLESAISWK